MWTLKIAALRPATGLSEQNFGARTQDRARAAAYIERPLIVTELSQSCYRTITEPAGFIMRLTALIVFSGIALATFPAASASPCPTFEGYPDCPLGENASQALSQGNLPLLYATSAVARKAAPAKLHRVRHANATIAPNAIK
jgi:hypothetical protein